jgi:class 3 adenylate cyclase/ligand-binding sensor domain-containing protein/predicted metal-dependent HD superfamily phosphohydrolase
VRLKNIFVFLFFVCSLSAFAQGEYRFRNFTINDGLSQSLVTTIIQDNNFGIWLGTQDGLNRFDGKSFEVFTPDDHEGILSQSFKCSAKSKDGRIWFGTLNGLTLYEPNSEKFKSFTLNKKQALQIESIYVDSKDNLWIATIGNGLLYFDTKKLTFSSFSHLIGNSKIHLVYGISEDELLVDTDDNQLFLISIKSKKARKLSIPQKTDKPATVQRIIQYSNEVYLLATSQGLYSFHISRKLVEPSFQLLDSQFGFLNITDVCRSGDKTFIATSNNGLFCIDKAWNITQYSEDLFRKDAILFNGLNTLFKDKSGSIWIGSERGLSSFDPNSKGFLGIGPSDNIARGLPSANVWSFGESPDGSYVFIGSDDGLSRLNLKTRRLEHFSRSALNPAEKDKSVVLSIHPISNNQVLAGCLDGLYILEINESGTYSFRPLNFLDPINSNKHDRTYSIIPYSKDQYFLATRSGVIFIDISQRTAKTFEHDTEKPNESISLGACRFGYKDQQGKFWFATSSGGLNYLKNTSDGFKIIPFEHNSIIKSKAIDYINSIYQSDDRTFWCGTNGSGLLKLDINNGNLQVFNRSSGLPNNVIYGVLQDEAGFLWLSSNKGLTKFDPVSKKAINYRENDGLMSNEFNLGAYLKSSDNTFYFGGIYGFNYFKPRDLLSSSKDIQVIFTKIKVDGQWVVPGEKKSVLSSTLANTKKITLSYRQRSFTIRFQPSELSNTNLVNYKYILEGSDEGEILIEGNNEIIFNALSPGKYVLKVYARSGLGPWSNVPATLEIIIESPFWSTWWFWTVIAAFLSLVVYIFVRRRIEQGRREQVKLEIKINERTREIREQKKQIEIQNEEIQREKDKVEEQQKLLQKEKDKTEGILLNILPESSVKELKSKGKVTAKAYNTVSVMFTDVVGFTKISENMTPNRLVGKLDVMFRKFDEIIVSNNLEKIKTIGDAYMCAGGVPEKNSTNPIDTCLAALQIQDYMARLKYDAIANHEDYWEIRLGVNTGSVTAGVIGTQRLAYDIWGSTVNEAQRMEMMGEPGKVMVSASTFSYIEPYFECEFKGKVQTKGKGLMDMYIVHRIKPELSVNNEGLFPNDRFNKIVNLHHFSSIKYYKTEHHVLKMLENGLEPNLYYHSLNHTKDVVKSVERLALLEGVTDEGLFLLKTAAIFHDAGFLESYQHNEPIGARMAEEILPQYGYTEDHIQTIKDLIFVTQIPHKPTNKLQEIICDADLDYLGRNDFEEIADKLRRELKERKIISSDKKWDEIQISFLRQHKYFTKTAIETRQKNKEKNIQLVIDRLERDEYID